MTPEELAVTLIRRFPRFARQAELDEAEDGDLTYLVLGLLVDWLSDLDREDEHEPVPAVLAVLEEAAIAAQQDPELRNLLGLELVVDGRLPDRVRAAAGPALRRVLSDAEADLARWAAGEDR